jgi:GH24 family phage-related lysozyme (muramidase)
MYKLIVSLPVNREFEGVVRLEEEGGRLVAGPFAVCGRADRKTAGRHGNPSGHALLPFGDTPLGRYKVAGIQPTGHKTSLAAERFGPHGVVVLTPTAGEAALADANGRFYIIIQGGKLGPGRRLRPTCGSLRMHDKDQKSLVRALRKSHPCVCECVAATEPVSSRTVARGASNEEADPPLAGTSIGLSGVDAASAGFGEGLSGGGKTRRFATPSFRLAADSAGGGGGSTGGGYDSYDSGSNFSKVDSSYVNKNEGFNAKVYNDAGLPAVGYGINLGFQTAASLKAAGVPQSIIDQVQPLLGMSAAQYATWSQKNSLTLSDADAKALSSDVQAQYFNATGSGFNSSTTLGVTFSDLPSEAQTALCDLWYNMGDLSSAAPNLWSQVTTGQWQAAITNLTNNFSSKDPVLNNRAAAAGQLLQNALNAGTLPKAKK